MIPIYNQSMNNNYHVSSAEKTIIIGSALPKISNVRSAEKTYMTQFSVSNPKFGHPKTAIFSLVHFSKILIHQKIVDLIF